MCNTNEGVHFEVEEVRREPSWIKVRYIQVAFLFSSLVIAFSMRICLSVGIVAMTTNGTSSNPDVPYYNWGNSNIILSSFFWSYAVLQFFAGNLLHWFGTKKLFFILVFMNSVASLLFPITAAYSGATGVIALRMIQGLFQGFLLPCMNATLGRWLPPEELSFLSSIVFSGGYVGIMGSMVITGYLSASWWGWPSAFYLFGSLGLIWCVLWQFFASETPATHPTISIEERKYIEHSLDQQNDHLIKKGSIPWSAILRSVPYWAIIVAAIGESWITTFMTVEIPSYLSYAVGLNITESSLFSAAPMVGGLIGSIVYGPIAGFTIKKGWVSKVTSRKMFHGFAIFSASLGLLLVSYMNDKVTIGVLLIASQTAASAVLCGHMINGIDLSPRFAGALSGISNGVGQLIAILAPLLVQFIVTDETDKAQWKYIFLMVAIIGCSTAIVFIIFGKGDRQWWDNLETNSSKEDGALDSGKSNPGFENDSIL